MKHIIQHALLDIQFDSDSDSVGQDATLQMLVSDQLGDILQIELERFVQIHNKQSLEGDFQNLRIPALAIDLDWARYEKYPHQFAKVFQHRLRQHLEHFVQSEEYAAQLEFIIAAEDQLVVNASSATRLVQPEAVSDYADLLEFLRCGEYSQQTENRSPQELLSRVLIDSPGRLRHFLASTAEPVVVDNLITQFDVPSIQKMVQILTPEVEYENIGASIAPDSSGSANEHSATHQILGVKHLRKEVDEPDVAILINSMLVSLRDKERRQHSEADISGQESSQLDSTLVNGGAWRNDITLVGRASGNEVGEEADQETAEGTAEEADKENDKDSSEAATGARLGFERTVVLSDSDYPDVVIADEDKPADAPNDAGRRDTQEFLDLVVEDEAPLSRLNLTMGNSVESADDPAIVIPESESESESESRPKLAIDREQMGFDEAEIELPEVPDEVDDIQEISTQNELTSVNDNTSVQEEITADLNQESPAPQTSANFEALVAVLQASVHFIPRQSRPPRSNVEDYVVNKNWEPAQQLASSTQALLSNTGEILDVHSVSANQSTNHCTNKNTKARKTLLARYQWLLELKADKKQLKAAARRLRQGQAIDVLDMLRLLKFNGSKLSLDSKTKANLRRSLYRQVQSLAGAEELLQHLPNSVLPTLGKLFSSKKIKHKECRRVFFLSQKELRMLIREELRKPAALDKKLHTLLANKKNGKFAQDNPSTGFNLPLHYKWILEPTDKLSSNFLVSTEYLSILEPLRQLRSLPRKKVRKQIRKVLVQYLADPLSLALLLTYLPLDAVDALGKFLFRHKGWKKSIRASLIMNKAALKQITVADKQRENLLALKLHLLNEHAQAQGHLASANFRSIDNKDSIVLSISDQIKNLRLNAEDPVLSAEQFSLLDWLHLGSPERQEIYSIFKEHANTNWLQRLIENSDPLVLLQIVQLGGVNELWHKLGVLAWLGRFGIEEPISSNELTVISDLIFRSRIDATAAQSRTRLHAWRYLLTFDAHGNAELLQGADDKSRDGFAEPLGIECVDDTDRETTADTNSEEDKNDRSQQSMQPLVSRFMTRYQSHQNEAQERLYRMGMWIDCAGLVIVGVYIDRLFQRAGLATEGVFNSAEDQIQGVFLLHYMVMGDQPIKPEHLGFAKILCGLDFDEPIEQPGPISEEHIELVEGLLQTIRYQWDIGDTTSAELRQTFLARQGVLRREDGFWRLKVNTAPYDVLLDRLPWSISTISLPWALAQLVEQLTVNQRVAGSSPAGGAISH